jgi:dTDP-4-dehydrorhamnose 3,5-epimerase-like enzyme
MPLNLHKAMFKGIIRGQHHSLRGVTDRSVIKSIHLECHKVMFKEVIRGIHLNQVTGKVVMDKVLNKEATREVMDKGNFHLERHKVTLKEVIRGLHLSQVMDKGNFHHLECHKVMLKGVISPQGST